jgi:hypothetical protein
VPQIKSKFIAVVDGPDDVPDDLPILSQDGCHYLSVCLATTEDGQWSTFVDVGMTLVKGTTPIEGYAPFDFYEFGYEITLADTDLIPSGSTMDRDIARRWLPKGCEKIVLQVVGACCRSLIGFFTPSYIYRVTFMPNPTENALKKHHWVTKVMESLGFSVFHSGTDSMSRQFWIMVASGVDPPPAL